MQNPKTLQTYDNVAYKKFHLYIYKIINDDMIEIVIGQKTIYHNLILKKKK